MRFGGFAKGTAIALGEIGERMLVEPLLSALKDKHEHVQAAVALALGKLLDQRAVEPLITALRDESKKVRKGAGRALKNITRKRFLFDNTNTEKWQKWWGQNKQKYMQ